MTKGGKQEVAAVGHNSYAGTRFNAVKHAVLSRYTVLPWEDSGEYEGLFSAVPSENPIRRRNSRVWPNRGKVGACVMPYDFCP